MYSAFLRFLSYFLMFLVLNIFSLEESLPDSELGFLAGTEACEESSLGRAGSLLADTAPYALAAVFDLSLVSGLTGFFLESSDKWNESPK